MGGVSAWLGRAGVEFTDVCAQERVVSTAPVVSPARVTLLLQPPPPGPCPLVSGKSGIKLVTSNIKHDVHAIHLITEFQDSR